MTGARAICSRASEWHRCPPSPGRNPADSNQDQARADAGARSPVPGARAVGGDAARLSPLAFGLTAPSCRGQTPEGAPPPAVEYADTEQDERSLHSRYRAFGRRHPDRLDLRSLRIAPGRGSRERYQSASEAPARMLSAPEILKNPVPVHTL